MQIGQAGAAGLPSTPTAGNRSGVVPLDALQQLGERAESEFFNALAAVPSLPGETWRLLPQANVQTAEALGKTVLLCAAIALAFALTRRWTRSRRISAGTNRNAFVGMLVLIGLELLSLLVATLVCRALLVRWLGIAPGTAAFPAEMAIALIRWMLALTVAMILFQPAVRRFRLASVDDAGARLAVWRIGAIIGVGHLHRVLLEAARQAGLSLPSVKLISCLVALGMAVAAVRLVVRLRRHGLPPALRIVAIALTLLLLAFWIGGWITLDFDLYRGAVGTITVLLLALVLDRAVTISIRDSRRPDMMRLLFVLRVVIDALAAALILRIIIEFWGMGALGLLSAAEWPAFARRLTFASIVLVLGVALGAVIHAWTEARLTPPESAVTTPDREWRLARLSTILPIIRFAAVTLIGVVFSLVALSAIGIDITPLMAGAGIVGLAISFGSQTLVKDIVSGIFYMIDDVFRLGETIETGGRRGQLEQINLRSVRLRDEDGRLHTIPLGDLGAVTNHSRRLVRMNVSVALDVLPEKNGLVRFSRRAAAALRSEPAIQAAIVGDIAVRLTEPVAEAEGALAFSFQLAATTASRHQELVQHLIEETVDEADVAGVLKKVDISILDSASASSAQAVTGPLLPQAMP